MEHPLLIRVKETDKIEEKIRIKPKKTNRIYDSQLGLGPEMEARITLIHAYRLLVNTKSIFYSIKNRSTAPNTALIQVLAIVELMAPLLLVEAAAAVVEEGFELEVEEPVVEALLVEAAPVEEATEPVVDPPIGAVD